MLPTGFGGDYSQKIKYINSIQCYQRDSPFTRGGSARAEKKIKLLNSCLRIGLMVLYWGIKYEYKIENF